MWTGLKRIMQRYLSILQSRSELIVNNLALRKQNAELRRLLELYSKSEVSEYSRTMEQSSMLLLFRSKWRGSLERAKLIDLQIDCLIVRPLSP